MHENPALPDSADHAVGVCPSAQSPSILRFAQCCRQSGGTEFATKEKSRYFNYSLLTSDLVIPTFASL